MSMGRFARIAGTGSYLPELRLSNQDLVDRLAKEGVESSVSFALNSFSNLFSLLSLISFPFGFSSLYLFTASKTNSCLQSFHSFFS